MSNAPDQIPCAAVLAEIHGFLAKTGMTRTSFGLGAVGQRALISDIEAGRDLRASTIQRIRDFMESELRNSAKKEAAA